MLPQSFYVFLSKIWFPPPKARDTLSELAASWDVHPLEAAKVRQGVLLRSQRKAKAIHDSTLVCARDERKADAWRDTTYHMFKIVKVHAHQRGCVGMKGIEIMARGTRKGNESARRSLVQKEGVGGRLRVCGCFTPPASWQVRVCTTRWHP